MSLVITRILLYNEALALERHVVPSGNYVVSRKAHMVLEAFLGSCVGVTICDKEAEVGGLIHLLLPEWSGYNKPLNPELYAKSGMPVFIEALCRAGADKSRMGAVVAGGALVGPVSQLDLNLDIGGKTTDIAQEILANEAIRIHRAETGGYFGCRFSLNLNSFDSCIEPISGRSDISITNFKKPTSEDIAGSIRRVKPVPQVTLKVLRMMNDGDYDIKKIAREIKKEQVISATVIRLCNSSYFGLNKKINTIDRAVIILGEKRLFQMIVSASLELYFHEAQGGYSLCKGGLFQHALGTAMIAERLAKYTGAVTPEIAYTAGLLHDIGKVVLDRFISSRYPFFYRRTQIDRIELSEVEKETLGITHAEAGKILGESWSLSEGLIDVITHHHHPERATLASELTHVVYFADLLMSRFGMGQELECLNTDNLSSRLQTIGVQTVQFPQMIDLMPQAIFEGAANDAFHSPK